MLAPVDSTVAGSTSLRETRSTQTLLQHIDEFRLWTFPILLATGKRLFANGTVPARLELVETRTSSTGVVLQVLRSTGEVEHGSFALEQPTAAEVSRRGRVAEETRGGKR